MNQNQSPFHPSAEVVVSNKFKIARSNLLMVIAFTVLNVILAAVNANLYLLFSASIPMLVMQIATGIVTDPEEFGIESVENPLSLLITFAVVAILLTLPYLFCWIFSKKHYGWMIAALVLFSLDSLLVVATLDVLNILFHAYVLYYLIMGVRNGAKMKKLAVSGAPQAPLEEMFTEDQASAPIPEDTPILRPASEVEEGRKVKVLVEADYEGHHLIFRKVGKQDELVVDDNVRAMMPHAPGAYYMTAVVDGKTIEAGVTNGRILIVVDGTVVAGATRWL